MADKYSLKKDGEKQLSANFKVKEFACKDGADEILIAGGLVAKLQQIRDHFDKEVNINSGYRTAAHNKAVGGSPNSQHLLGMAADISIAGVTPLQIAQYAEYLFGKTTGGIGLYGTFVHIDIRAARSRWDQRSGSAVNVPDGYPGYTPTRDDINVTIDNAYVINMLNDKAYWEDVLRGKTIPKPQNIKALIDKAYGLIRG